MATPRPLLIALILLTLLRAVLAAVHEVCPAEALIWLCAERPAAGYFSHGPLAAWLEAPMAALGWHTPAAVRWLAPLLTLWVSLVVHRLAGSLFGEKEARWSVVLLNLTPLFNAAGVLWLPGTLGFALWTAALLMLWRALHRASPWNVHWVAGGLLMALGIMASPVNLLQPLCLLGVLTLSRRWRGRLLSAGPWLSTFLSAAGAVPWLWWHRGNSWLALRVHQREWTDGVSAEALAPFLGWVLVAFSPLLAAGLVWATALAGVRLLQARSRPGRPAEVPPDALLFCLGFGLPPLGLAAAGAVSGLDGIAALAPSALSLGLALVALWLRMDLSPATTRLAQNATLLVAGAYSVVLAQTDLLRHWGVPWPYRLDPTVKFRGWRTSAEQLAAIAASMEKKTGRPVFLIADSAALAAALDYHLQPLLGEGPLSPRVQPLASAVPRSDFAFWPRYDFRPASGKLIEASAGALYVADGPLQAPPGALARSFAGVQRLGTIEVMRGGHGVRELALFACYDYRGPPF